MACTPTYRVIFLLSIWVVCIVLYFGSKKLSLSPNPASHTHHDNSLNPSESTKTEINKDTLQAESSFAIISEFRQRYISWYEGQFTNRIRPGPDHVTNSSKYLIYRCGYGIGSGRACGGWADRVKGMMVTYLIANLTGRVFKLEVKSPACQLTDLVVPNLVNWSLPASIHPTLDEDTPRTKTISMVGNKRFYFDIHKTNFHKLIGDKDYIYFQANLDYSDGFRASSVYKQELSWMTNLTNAQILSTVYTRLFKLSPILFSRLQDFLARTLPTPQHRLICAQLRVGKNPNIPNDSETRLDIKSLSKVWNFFANHSKSDLEPIFIMTDSDDLLNVAKTKSFGSRVISTPGPVMHVAISRSKNTEDVCSSLEKVIFDQHVLMNCDVLMVSKSGLGRLAAYVRGSAKGLYCLHKTGHQLDPCEPGKIKPLFKITG